MHLFVHYTTGPTYGELIDLLTKLEGKPDVIDLLCSELCIQYPNISFTRLTTLFDALKPIAGPTQPSLGCPAKLTGSPLASYRKRVWKPRIRNSQISG